MAQVVLVGITWYVAGRVMPDKNLTTVCSFATTGMYSAVSNLGAGGTEDVSLSDISNGVLYGFFAVVGVISGGITNRTSTPSQAFSLRSVLETAPPRGAVSGRCMQSLRTGL